jgi:hypothetical protein
MADNETMTDREALARAMFRGTDWDTSAEWERGVFYELADVALAWFAACGVGADGVNTENLVLLSKWIDAGNRDRDPEAVLWGRVSKITEEAGEAIAALIGMTGQNPRKGVTHDRNDLVGELLDVAITALGAVEHVTGHNGQAMPMLTNKLHTVTNRALHQQPSAPTPKEGN